MSNVVTFPSKLNQPSLTLQAGLEAVSSIPSQSAGANSQIPSQQLFALRVADALEQLQLAQISLQDAARCAPSSDAVKVALGSGISVAALAGQIRVSLGGAA